jgi:alpha-tubulin suppressor-like RCC1 family protein
VKDDGTVWAWGDNSYGQLGDATLIDRNYPAQVSGLNNITHISAGYGHNLVMKDDQTFWSWGSNVSGQLGNGSATKRYSPVQTLALTDVDMVSAGLEHTIALHAEGSVWAWGSNEKGQLGNGTTTNETSPCQLPDLSNISSIASGASHNIALADDGTVWAWGDNDSGQLGDGTTTSRSSPIQTNGLSNITLIEAGGKHSLALKNDGTVWAWGANDSKQLGDGTTTSRNSPVQISDLSNITLFSAGTSHNLALRNDGTVWTWGNWNNPNQVSILSSITLIAAGGNHSLALKDDGTVWAWGDNWAGQLGNGNTETYESSPVQVSDLSNITMIAAGESHSLALKDDGTVWAWGANWDGQLGDGTYTSRSTPLQIMGLSDITSIVAGDNHSLAIKNDGTVWAWGANPKGQIGDGTISGQTSPEMILSNQFTTIINTPMRVIFSVTDAESSPCDISLTLVSSNPNLITDSNFTYTCQEDSYYIQVTPTINQAGTSSITIIATDSDGLTASQTFGVTITNSPPVFDLQNFSILYAGGSHSLALKEDGSLWSWGANNYGQLGDNTNQDRTKPVQVNHLSTGVTHADGGFEHSIALKDDGTVWTWGTIMRDSWVMAQQHQAAIQYRSADYTTLHQLQLEICIISHSKMMALFGHGEPTGLVS